MGQIIFIDLEASSLSDDSWPIEVGFAWLDGEEKLRGASKLIRPHASWAKSAWSEKSAKIHKIPRSELETAERAEDVAFWVIDFVGDAQLLSDAPKFDGHWLQRLLATIETDQAFEIHAVQEAARVEFAGAAMSMFYRAFANNRTTHRAEEDALRLAQAWRAAVRKQRLAAK